jgi:hypothetical protein
MFNLNRVSDPGSAIFTVIICVAALLVASYPVIKMIGWWIEGGAEPLLAMVSIFLYIALVGFAMAAPPPVAGLIFVVIVVSAIATPVFGQVSDNVQLRRMDESRMETFARVLDGDPMNAPARMGLAECLHKRGEIEQAIEHMSWTLERFPKLGFSIKPKLDAWIREKDRQGVAQNVYCHMCHCENAYNATHCYECGAAFGTKAGVRQEAWRHGGPKAVIRGWIVTSVSVILILIMFAIMPIEFAAPLTVATLIVAFWLFLKWIGGDMGTIGD